MDKIIQKLQELYREKNYIKLVAASVATLLVAFLLVALTYCIGTQIFFFLAKRFEAVIAIVGGYIMLYLWWRDKQKRQQEEIQNSLAEAVIAQQSSEKALCENNYSTVRQCLFSVLSEYADILNLVKPEIESELNCHPKTAFKGNVYVCQFLVPKMGEANPGKIKEILQTRIRQKLSAFEFAGIAQTNYIYKGIAYPILCVDDVRDTGIHVQIDMAWASERYCSLLDSREYARMQHLQPPINNFHDKDF